MNFQVSARKWRPQTFDEVVGQKHLIRVLSNSVLQGEIAQAYLFSGTRGVGKTTVARILAKAINCADTKKAPCGLCVSCKEISENRSVDVIEIDGASNNSVEDVRDLREKVKYLPLSGKYKVYIIDEVHMLSGGAFNALLKTLEEPPVRLIFILATTEAHKIPATILSRCQHFIFRRIPRIEIETQLRKILSEKNIAMPDRVITFIANAADGSLRDALSLFDQAISYSGKNVTEEDLSTLFGRAAGTTFHSLVLGIAKKDADALLGIAREIENGGYNLRQFLADWIERLRNLIVIKNVKDVSSFIDLPDEEKKELEKEAGFFSQAEMLSLFAIFVKLQDDIHYAPRPHLLLEVAFMKAVLLSDLTPIEKIIADIRGRTNIAPQTAGVTIPAARTAPVKETISAPKTPSVITPATDILSEKSSPKPLPPQGTLPPQGALPSPETIGLWKNLLRDVKKTRPNLASYLDQGVLLAVLEQTVKIGFSEESSFLISLIEKEENKKLLRPLLKSYFKRDLGLTFIELPLSPKETDSKGPEQPKSIPIGGESVGTPTAINAGNISETLVEEALRVFGGEIVH